MSSSYNQGRSERAVPPVPGVPGAVLLAERLAERRAELAEECPEALEWAGLVLWRLHEELYGKAASLACDRKPRYRRNQLAGERSLPLEDLVFLALADPNAVRPALDCLLMAIGRVSVSIGAAEGSVCGINSSILRAFGEFEARLAEAQEDGVLDGGEIVELLDHLQGLSDKLNALMVSIGRS